MAPRHRVRTSLIALALLAGLGGVATAGPAAAGCSPKGMIGCGPALPPPR